MRAHFSALIKRPFFLAALLALLAVLMYFPVFKADYIWDDDAYVIQNKNLQSVQGLKRIWLEPQASPQYYPLVFSSFWIERQLFGLDPHASHWINVCLHILNALLLWAVLRKLGVAASFLIALVFALHPVHLESVAWITERKNVLSAFFYLLSMLAYLAFSLPRKTPAVKARLRPLALYALSMLLFVCAMLSKTVTATLPVIILSLLWWKKESLGKRDWLAIAPMAVLGIVFGLSTVWLEVHHVGALGDEWNISFVGRILIAARAIWFYIGKLLWPHPLSFVYPRWSIDAGDSWQYAYPLSLLAAGLAAWFFRKKIGKGALVAVFFFICTLFPALGFFNVYPMRFSYVADHFQYLASIGVIALAIVAARSILFRFKLIKLRTAAVPVLIFMLLLSGRQEVKKYHDLETLWNDTIRKNPSGWMAYNNLGALKLKQQKFAEARACFREVIKRKPEMANAFANLGMAWMAEGNLEKAKENFSKALQRDPRDAKAHNNMGIVLGRENNFSQAIIHYQEALRIDPDYAMAHYNLANIWNRKKDHEKAEKHYLAAIRLQPDLAMAYYYYGLGLLVRGRTLAAGQNLATSFKIKPDFALGYFQVGNILMEQGKMSAAVTYYYKAVAIDPGFAEAHCNLGTALLNLSKLGPAIGHFRAALQHNPDQALAENNLGAALEQSGKLEEAIAHYIRAVKLAPDFKKAKENLDRALRRKTLLSEK